MSESFWLALIGILGTLAGGVTVWMGNYWLQKRQRAWASEDQRREWKKQYREKQVAPLQMLVRTWLNNPDDFFHITEQGQSAIDLPRGSAWGIPDANLQRALLHFMELIRNYYDAEKAKPSNGTNILGEISTLCAQLEKEFERYISDV